MKCCQTIAIEGTDDSFDKKSEEGIHEYLKVFLKQMRDTSENNGYYVAALRRAVITFK